MNLKKLNLCEKEQLLNYLSSKYYIKEIKESKENQLNIKISYQNKDALLVFYFNSNGTTTINTSQGKNKDINEKIAKQIVNECLIYNKKKCIIFIKQYPT